MFLTSANTTLETTTLKKQQYFQCSFVCSQHSWREDFVLPTTVVRMTVCLHFSLNCSSFWHHLFIVHAPKNVLVCFFFSLFKRRNKDEKIWLSVLWHFLVFFFGLFSGDAPSIARFSAKKQIKILSFCLFICERAIPVRGATATSFCSCGRRRRRRRRRRHHHLVLLPRRRRGVQGSASGIA